MQGEGCTCVAVALGCTDLVCDLIFEDAARDEVVESVEFEGRFFICLLDRRVEEPDAFLGVALPSIVRAVDGGAGDVDDFKVVAIRVEGGRNGVRVVVADERAPEIGAEIVEGHRR